MSNLQPGTVMSLSVDREVPFGYFLTDGRDSVLLHQSEIVGEVGLDEEVDVFLFQDKEGRLAATMNVPDVQVGRYGWAEVVGVQRGLGVFVNIGVMKDILISPDDLPIYQEIWPAEGDKLYMSLKADRNGLLYGKIATEQVIEQITTKAPADMKNKDIKGRVYRLLRVGTFLLTEEGYRCFVHESERPKEPRLGALVDGRVIDVKDDGSLNVSLFPRKQEKMDDDSQKILAYLEERNGSMPYGDKSHPDEIQRRFGMSKASFKRALGKLMKERKIRQEDGWTYSADKK